MDEDTLYLSLNLPPRDPLDLLIKTAKSRISDNTPPKLPPNLTDTQITDILSVIPAPPCIDEETRKLVWTKIVEIVRKDLKTKYVNPASIEKLKHALKYHIQLSFSVAGTPIGISSIADDIGAGALQGALDARKKPGSRQNAAGGIKVMREVLQLSKRSIPMVTAYFSKSQSFYDIMKDWRPKLVHLTLENLVMSYDIYLTSKTPYPSWYNAYIKMRNNIDDIPFVLPNVNAHYVVIKLNINMMYAYKITPEQLYTHIRKTLDTANTKLFKKKKPLSDFLILYPPGATKELHCIPITEGSTNINVQVKSKTEEDEEDESVTSDRTNVIQNQQYIIRTRLPELLDSYISGIPGVTYVYPVGIPVLDSITGETNINEVYTIDIDQHKKKYHGIDEERIGKLFNATGCSIISTEPLKIKVPTIIKSPVEYTKGKISDEIRDKIIPYINETEQRNGSWIIDIKNNELSTSQVSSFFSLTGVSVLSENPLIVKPPTIKESAITFVKRKVAEDIAEQAAYELTQRLARYSGKQVSLIRPPTSIELATTHYFIECTGGIFEAFLDMDGIDISRTYSNNIKEMHEFIGIEGARALLVKEIDLTFTNSNLKLEAVTIHTAASKMTYMGHLNPYTYNGISSTRIGTLAKTTLQRPVYTIQQATVNKEVDNLNSVSGSIMVGKRVNLGTGLPKTLYENKNTYDVIEDTNEFNSNNRVCRIYD